MNYQGGELESQYKRLSSNLERSEDAADAVRKRVHDVQEVGDADVIRSRAKVAAVAASKEM